MFAPSYPESGFDVSEFGVTLSYLPIGYSTADDVMQNLRERKLLSMLLYGRLVIT